MKSLSSNIYTFNSFIVTAMSLFNTTLDSATIFYNRYQL